MSIVTASGTGWIASGSNFNLPFASVSGRSLVVIANNESAVNDITGLTDSAGNTWVDEFSGAYSGGNGRRVFRCKTVGTAPTWVKTTGSSGTIHYVVVEATGMDSGAIESCAAYADTGTALAHIASFATASSNAMAVVHVMSGTDLGTITPTNGFTEIPSARAARAAFFDEDLGASGSKTLTYDSSSGPIGVNYVIAIYKSAVTDPTVVSVTGTTVTEGGSNVYTVTLSGATNRTTNYAASSPGGTATGADYDNDLGNATYSDSVTFSGGNMVVPTGVTVFTFTVATTQDALDEADETVFPTVGGVAAVTGTITDDDAPPTISVTDASENAMEVVLTVSLSQASGKTITVDYATADGAKTAGTDYTAASGTLTFAAGETTKTVTVAVL